MHKVCRKSCDWPSLLYPDSAEEMILDLRTKVNEIFTLRVENGLEGCIWKIDQGP